MISTIILGLLAIVAAILGSPTADAAAARDGAGELPPFLPSYYAPAFVVGGTHLKLSDHVEKDNNDRYVYGVDDLSATLTIDGYKCDIARCKVVFDNALRYADTEASRNAGKFHAVTATEFQAEWHTGLADVSAFVFVLPHSLLFWTYSTRLSRPLDIDAYFDEVKLFVDQERYDEARATDNVEMGRWDAQFRELAGRLLKDGRRDAALAVLKDVVETSPYDYEAHMDLAANARDAKEAQANARVVLDNAEDPALIARATRLLGIDEQGAVSIPILDKDEKGLQLILIPLPPCDAGLLTDAAKVYEQITNVPVKIRRLREDWAFGVPDRIPDQKRIQQAIVQQEGPGVDFTGWTKARYESELMKNATGQDALSRFWTIRYIEQLDDKPGQYRTAPYLDRFLDILASYRSSDIRTMYVGVTEANIYDGDSNYVFSLFTSRKGAGASILSYSMMLAKTLGEPYQSRKRLSERIAKELVPASLKALAIPRPGDPSDPYSYSDGVARLDQKTLVLSPAVKAALDKFR